MAKIFIDDRWAGNHGIARFSRELQNRIQFESLGMHGSPTAVLDVVRLSLRMLFCKSITFSPGFNAPLIGLSRYIFTIHDLNHVDTKTGLLKKLYYKLIVRRACRKVPFVFTVSEYSRERIIEWSGISSDRVVNVGNGVSEVFSNAGIKFDYGHPYLVCIGNRKPHKNECRVIEAFAKASINPDIHLLFNGSGSDELLKLSSMLGVSNRVSFIGLLEEATLASVYRGALALVFPSLYEGFGFPVLEAMACGTPVLTSKITSLPEIAGDAAVLVNPLSVVDIKQGIERIIKDQYLRQNLIRSGLARSKQYSWTAVACRVKDALNKLDL